MICWRVVVAFNEDSHRWRVHGGGARDALELHGNDRMSTLLAMQGDAPPGPVIGNDSIADMEV